MRPLALVLIIGITGCGTKYVWTKPEFTDQEFNRDVAECKHMAMGPAYYPDVYERCMKGKGWTLKRKT